MTFSHNMETLSNNNIFNFGGFGTMVAFAGTQASNFFNLTSFTPLVTFIIGIFSLLFIMMRVYLTFLETRKFKKENPDIKGKKNKKIMANISVTVEKIKTDGTRSYTPPSPVVMLVGIGDGYDVAPSGTGSTIYLRDTDTEYTVSESQSEVETLIGDGVYVSNQGVPSTYTEATASGNEWVIQKGVLNKYRLRPQCLNEHQESSRQVMGTVTSSNIVGQVYKASQDNINGIMLTLESAGGTVIDDFESYADSAAIQVVWVETNGAYPALLDTTIIKDGAKSMHLPLDCVANDEWADAIVSTDYTGFTFEFDYYQIKKYDKAQVEFFIEDSAGNSKHGFIAVTGENFWSHFEFIEGSMTEHIGNTLDTDTTDIVAYGYRCTKRDNNGEGYIDNLKFIPEGGSVNLKIFDMGTSLPTTGVTSLDDGTQYVGLSDLGFNGNNPQASITLDLVGGKKLYTVKDFVAGVALEIPTNETLNIDNYYAITVNYVDTNVSVYGANSSYGIEYYNNGYAFNATNESTAIVSNGAYHDCMFGIFSICPVYVNTLVKFYDEAPSLSARESVLLKMQE